MVLTGGPKSSFVGESRQSRPKRELFALHDSTRAGGPSVRSEVAKLHGSGAPGSSGQANCGRDEKVVGCAAERRLIRPMLGGSPVTARPSTADSNDEIDLRQLIQALLDGWRWIAAATLVAGLAALAVSLLLPKQYEASAAIVLTKPDVVFNFDPRITTQYNVPPAEGLPELVSSDEILTKVIDHTTPEGAGGEPIKLAQLRELASASISGVGITLRIEDSDAKRSAALVNAWAGIAVERLNAVYAPSGEAKSSYEKQAAEAFNEWHEAQLALVEFQSTNKEGVLEDKLASLHSDLRSNLNARWSLGLAIMDANTLMARLASEGSAYNARDDLASLVLALRSLTSTSPIALGDQWEASAGQSGTDGPQLLLQINGTSFLSGSTGEQLGFLSDLVDSMQKQQGEHNQAAADLEASIPEVQGELARAQEARQTLETQRDLARDTYQALARKVQESRLASESDTSIARVASESLVPSEPVGPRVKLNTAVASALGLMLGLVWVILARWWLAAEQTPTGD